ncbi:class I SAM-dependent methyltransferase [candidate division CSSED10-310 bacterium]|uniref:Class I SAM-dependent methyltransferase n=1 Tax=candidate division CSSED10-310 bacterium TaxID=2855610 RepID=A0ABV6YWX3_UNCC1
MAHDLDLHYNSKFREEKKGAQSGLMRDFSFPVNRQEACVSFFSRYFNSGSILELGAGNGVTARNLLHRLSTCNSYVASDFSSESIVHLRTYLDDPRVTVTHLDVENISGDEDKYDAIIMVALIEHLINPLKTLQRIQRMLKPSGFLYIDTPNVAKYTRRLQLLLGKFPSTASKNEGLTLYSGGPVDLLDEGHLSYFTYRSLRKLLLERCGFSRTEKLAYSNGKYFGKQFENRLARLWPEMFSSSAVFIAYR